VRPVLAVIRQEDYEHRRTIMQIGIYYKQDNDRNCNEVESCPQLCYRTWTGVPAGDASKAEISKLLEKKSSNSCMDLDLASFCGSCADTA